MMPASSLPVPIYSFRFKHIDNLGAYNIPSETDLLVPAEFVNLVFASAIAPTPLH
jgi:hypothetical protein